MVLPLVLVVSHLSQEQRMCRHCMYCGIICCTCVHTVYYMHPYCLLHASILFITCVHTYIHVYIHASIHKYMCTYMRPYINTCVHTVYYMRTYIHVYIHASIHKYMCTYMCPYIHTCVHTCMHTYICVHSVYSVPAIALCLCIAFGHVP